LIIAYIVSKKLSLSRPKINKINNKVNKINISLIFPLFLRATKDINPKKDP
jgi:hypothetical protein